MARSELESSEESADAAKRNVDTFCETQGAAGGAVECIELEDMTQPSSEFSHLMAEDDASDPPAPNCRRQIKALMKIRLLSERRMPSLWISRIVAPVFLVLFGALRWAVPVGLSTFPRLELTASHYVNNLRLNQSAVNPGLAFLSSTPTGMSLTL